MRDHQSWLVGAGGVIARTDEIDPVVAWRPREHARVGFRISQRAERPARHRLHRPHAHLRHGLTAH